MRPRKSTGPSATSSPAGGSSIPFGITVTRARGLAAATRRASTSLSTTKWRYSASPRRSTASKGSPYRRCMSAPQSIWTSPTTGQRATSGSRLADTGGVRLSIHTSGRTTSASSGTSSENRICPPRAPAHPTGRWT